MQNQIGMSPQMREFLAAPEAPEDTRDAFSVHGVWTPAVKLMRNIPFHIKAGIVSLLFLVPLAIAGWAYVSAQNQQITFGTKERVGLSYAQQVTPIMGKLQEVRKLQVQQLYSGSEPAGLAQAQSAVEQQMQLILAAEQTFGTDMGSSKAVADLQAAIAKLPVKGAGEVPLVMKAFEESNAKAAALLDAILDGSNLILDPDIDTYYLMDASLLRLPVLAATANSIRDRAASIANGAALDVDTGRAMGGDEALGDFMDAGLAVSVGKVLGQHPELAGTISTQAGVEALHALHEKIGALSTADASKPSVEEVNKLGETASLGLIKAQTAMLEQLGVLLDARISGLKRGLYINLTLMGISLIFAFYFFYGFYLVTRGGLVLISKHLREISTGDLRTLPHKPLGSDEPAQVILDMRVAYESLHALIRKVRHSARALHAAAGEIAAASTDLGARTESAAAALEEQASSMEEISSTVSATSDRASSAATFAVDNAHVAERGGAVFSEVVATMREIHTSSTKINDIIGVIDGIAFQTNILALNAAVEAARAGDAGRGFAVVAAEVRTLAQRSAGAAREIKGLIATSVGKVESGARVVEAAGSTMSEVVTNARQINQFLGEIATSAREQAAGVAEVGRSIQELDKNTQQNAALVEQTNAAAGALTAQADVLQDEISNFRVA